MKTIFRIQNLLLIIPLSFLMVNCSDYLDVDTDTDAPVVAPIEQLLPNIQLGISNFNNFNFWSGEALAVYTHQFTSREEFDQYGVRPSNIFIQNEWDNTYLTLTDIETLIETATESGDLQYVGVAQILKAYLMAGSVDLWGSIPYSEATSLEEGIVGASFDEQEAIYQSVLDLLDEGEANIESGEGITPSADDLIYSGDMDKWIKFANSYKLKLYNQIKTTSLFNSADFDALISEGEFMSSIADDFEFEHSTNQSPTDERNQLFLGAYGGTQFGNYISPWFYEILQGWNPDIFTGIEDPRIPYYWVNQLKDGEFPSDQGNAETGDPNSDYWDEDTGFFSIRFGSIGTDRDHSVETDVTYPGIFPAGGLYDANTGYLIDINSGTGAAPHRMFTYDEFLYVKAELVLEGLIAGDPAAAFEEAMRESFKQVDEVVAGTGTTQDVPELVGSEEVEAYIGEILALFAAASEEKKLEILITQKWISTFGDSADQYADYRRTGYPILANPLSNKKEYQLDMGAFPIDDDLTVQNNPFQRSLYWPQSEVNLNQNAPPQKDPSTYNIFWDN